MNIIKSFTLATLVSLLVNNSYGGSLPTTEEFQGMLQGCALGLNLEIDAKIIGSIATIYKGNRTSGKVIIKSETEFIELFPKDQRTKVYGLYIKCINRFLEQSTINSPAQNVTIIKGIEGAAIPLSPSAHVNTVTIGLDIIRKMQQGEEVTPAEAYKSIFIKQAYIPSGTAVEKLSEPSEYGILSMIKVRILEGAHQGKEGWVSVSVLATEQRLAK